MGPDGPPADGARVREGREGDDPDLDDDAAIRARVLAALARVPGAIGINNHQGSKATADPRVLRDVLLVVKEKGLFFLDSRTTPARRATRSRAPSASRSSRGTSSSTTRRPRRRTGAPGRPGRCVGAAVSLATSKGRLSSSATPSGDRRVPRAALPKLAARGLRPVKVSDSSPRRQPSAAFASSQSRSSSSSGVFERSPRQPRRGGHLLEAAAEAGVRGLKAPRGQREAGARR